MTDAREHIGLGGRGAVGLAAGAEEFGFGLLDLGEIAEHGEEIRPSGAGAADDHRQRHEAAGADLAERLAAVIEQAGSAGLFHAGEIVADDAAALMGEQIDHVALGE